MGGAVCTKIDEVGPKTKEMFELDFDMEQAELIEMTEKYKLYRIKKNQNINGKRNKQNGVYVHGKKMKGEEENIDGKILTVKFENHIIYPGNVIGSYLPKDEKLLNLEPHKNIIKIYDIYSWDESKSVLQQVFIIENIQGTLLQELRGMELKNQVYSDDEFLKLIEDMIQGLEFLRKKGLSVTIDIDHIYKVENDYKWASYESIGFYDHPMPIQHELNQIYQLLLVIIQKIFRSNEVSVLRSKHQKSWRLIQQIQQYMEQNLNNEFYQKFYHLSNTIKDLDGGYLFTKIIEEINIKINLKNQHDLVEQLKKYKPHELNLEIEGKEDVLWKTVCEEIRKMIELKSLELKSESNMIQSSRASDIFLEVANSCRMLDNLSLKWKDNLIDSNFWHYFQTYFSQFEFINLKLELKNNYISNQYHYLKQFLINQQNILIILHLDLENNQITKTEVEDLAEGISKLQMLQQLNLNLSNNYISNLGYSDLMVGISSLSYISSLNLSLSKCYIEYDGFLATEYLVYLDNLTEIKLDLSYNSLMKKQNVNKAEFKRTERINAEKNKTEFYKNLINELDKFPQTGTIIVQNPSGDPLPPPPSLIEEIDENSSRATQTKIKGFYGTKNSFNQNLDERQESGSIFNGEAKSNNKSDQSPFPFGSSSFKDQKISSSSLLQQKQNRQINNQQSKISSLRRIDEEIKTENRRRQNSKKNPFSFVNNPQLNLIYLNLNKTDLQEEHLEDFCERLSIQRDRIKYLQLKIAQNKDLVNFKILAESIMLLKDCIELDINCEKSYYNIGSRDFIDFHLGSLLGLRKLSLNFNYIMLQYTSMNNLFQNIQYLSEIIELELSFFENQLGNTGFVMLGESLKNLRKLMNLKIFCFKVGVNSMVQFDEGENMLSLNNQNTQTNLFRKNQPNSNQSTQLIQQQQISIINLQSPQSLEYGHSEIDQIQYQQSNENENMNDIQQYQFKDLQLGMAQSNIIGPSQLSNLNLLGMTSNTNTIQQQQQQTNTYAKQQSLVLQSMNTPIHGFASPVLVSIPDNALLPLSKSISQMPLLQVLYVCLSRNSIGSQGIQSFIQCLVNKPNLRELNLSFRQCSIESFTQLFLAINGLSYSLKVLKLNLKFNQNLNVSLVQANNYFQNMIIEDLSLHFEDNTLDDMSIMSIANNLLFLNQTLKSFSLFMNQSNQLQDSQINKLFLSISKCLLLSNLKLDFQNLQLRNVQGIEKLSELINLKSLSINLKNCCFDKNGGANIGQSISYIEPKLEALNLNLESNGIDSSSLISIANNLRGLSGCLKQLKLNISSNTLDEGSFQTLFYTIQELTELTELDLNLSKNSLSEISPQVFACLIPVKCQLKYILLNLRKTSITPSMCNALFQRMSKLTNILDISLDLSGNVLERSFGRQYNQNSQQYLQQQQQNLINIVNEGEKTGTPINLQAEGEQSNQVVLVPGHSKGPSVTSIQSLPKPPSIQLLTQQIIQERQQEKPQPTHQHNHSQPSIIHLLSQMQSNRQQFSSNPSVNNPINPFEAFPEAIVNMEHLCSFKIDIYQNNATFNKSLFSLTHGIVTSCIKIHHIKIRSENWQDCYTPFMLYYIQVRNQILTILARNKMMLKFPKEMVASTLTNWDYLYISSLT